MPPPRVQKTQLTSGCSAVSGKTSAKSTNCLRAGWPFRVVPKFDVRELGIYSPFSSVSGCRLLLKGGMTLDKVMSPFSWVIPKEGWQLNAVYRLPPGPEAGEAGPSREACLKFHMASHWQHSEHHCLCFGSHMVEWGSSLRLTFGSHSLAAVTGKGVFWQSQVESLVFSPILELRI